MASDKIHCVNCDIKITRKHYKRHLTLGDILGILRDVLRILYQKYIKIYWEFDNLGLRDNNNNIYKHKKLAQEQLKELECSFNTWTSDYNS